MAPYSATYCKSPLDHTHYRPGRCQVSLPMSRMQTEYRGKDAVLDPTGDQLITSSAEHVAAYVMTPPSVADVRGSRSELWLKLQRCPADDRIAGKADRVAMTTWPAKPRKYDSLSAVASGIQELEMVQHPANERNQLTLPRRPVIRSWESTHHKGSIPGMRECSPCCQSILAIC
jgi:hypothetical protein